MQQIFALYNSIDFDKLKSLISKEPYLENLKEDFSMYSVLKFAVVNKDLDLVKYLLNIGCNPNQCSGQNDYPIFDIIFEENKEILHELIKNEKTDIHVTNSQYNVPLYYTCINEDYESTKLLIERGANVNYYNICGESILDVTNNLNILELLLQNGANSNLEHHLSLETPIINAVRELNYEKLDLMIKYGAKLDKETSLSESALSTAYAMKNKQMIDYLISKLNF